MPDLPIEQNPKVENLESSDSVDMVSKAFMPDMTDQDIMSSFEKDYDESDFLPKVSLIESNESGEEGMEKQDPLGQTKEQREARERVVDFTSKVLGEHKFNDLGKKMTQAAMKHQYFHGGGAKAVDALAKDISAKLPDGMKLEITDDAQFRKMVKDNLKPGDKMPDYLRKIELKDKNGKVLGAFGFGISEVKEKLRKAPPKEDRIA